MVNPWPKISVFTLSYNGSLFIRDCIDSILLQEYPNLEIVIGDDGSTDGTQEILKEYDSKYPGLFKLLLNETNTGITANCNRILAACTGDYIAFLAGDDFWLPGKLIKQIEWFKVNPDKILCFTLTEVFDHDTRQIIAIEPAGDKSQYIVTSPIQQAYILGQVESSFLLDRRFVPVIGFETSVPNVSDLIFMIEIFLQGKIGYLDEILTKYRKHNNSTSKNSEKIWIEHYLSYLNLETKYPVLTEDIATFKRDIIYTLLVMNSEPGKRIEKQIMNTFKISELLFDIFRRLIKKLKFAGK